jgi:hypothetical protein
MSVKKKSKLCLQEEQVFRLMEKGDSMISSTE